VSRAALAALVGLLATGGAVALAVRDPEPSAVREWRPLASAGLERTEVAAARIGGSIYVTGGFERASGATTAAAERYDIRRDRWTRVRPMPLALNHAVAVAHRGRLYVHGGYRGATGLSSPTDALLEYDPSRDRWRRLRGSGSARAAHAAAVVGGRLYVAAGANAEGSLRSMQSYEFERRRWRREPALRGPARNHTAGVAGGRFVYVLAGRDSENYAVAERFDTRRRVWQRLPSLRTPRGGIAAARLRDGRIVVFGGENLEPGGTTIAPVELFDPRRRRWSQLPDMRTPRHGLGGAALGSRVYSLAGGPRPGFAFSGALEFLDVR
jgi:N-acetylneuraminic acid mutarotase